MPLKPPAHMYESIVHLHRQVIGTRSEQDLLTLSPADRGHIVDDILQAAWDLHRPLANTDIQPLGDVRSYGGSLIGGARGAHVSLVDDHLIALFDEPQWCVKASEIDLDQGPEAIKEQIATVLGTNVDYACSDDYLALCALTADTEKGADSIWYVLSHEVGHIAQISSPLTAGPYLTSAMGYGINLTWLAAGVFVSERLRSRFSFRGGSPLAAAIGSQSALGGAIITWHTINKRYAGLHQRIKEWDADAFAARDLRATRGGVYYHTCHLAAEKEHYGLWHPIHDLKARFFSTHPTHAQRLAFFQERLRQLESPAYTTS